MADDVKALREQVARDQEAVQKTATQVGAQAAPEGWWNTKSAMTISSVVLVFGLLVFCLATYLIRSGKDGEMVLRVFATILIVFLAVFLVVAGYSDTQIAPVLGLLGTIAGYLLGKADRTKDPKDEKPKTAQPVP